MHNNWTEKENTALLDAMEQGVNIEHIIEIACDKTGRIAASVKRRLTKMGYLRTCGRSFTHKQGFVR